MTDPRWQMLIDRSDAPFFYAVRTTGVYCRPACPSRRPAPENVEYFDSREDAQRAGYRPCRRCRPESAHEPGTELVARICRYLEENRDRPVRLQELAGRFALSPAHLQRTFRAATGISPRAYAATLRVDALREGLRAGPVTAALYDAGYGSSSRLYETARHDLGMSPGEYQKAAAGQQIRFTVADTPFGLLLLAATARGLCSVRFGESAAELEAELRAEFGRAEIEAGEDALAGYRERVLALFEHDRPRAELPLDVRATAFQRRVWEALQQIPRGATRSYRQVAEAIGDPGAVRAVASACAANPVALVVPCHRVVRTGGLLSGYRWGVERKRKLLEWEQS